MSKRTDKNGGNGGAAPRDYEVGFGKPPKHRQFQKGQSGNPKGRPKGAADDRAILKRIEEEFVTVRDGGRMRRMSKREFFWRDEMNLALKGDRKARERILAVKRWSGEFKEPAPVATSKSGVLVIPAPMSTTEWEKCFLEGTAETYRRADAAMRAWGVADAAKQRALAEKAEGEAESTPPKPQTP